MVLFWNHCSPKSNTSNVRIAHLRLMVQSVKIILFRFFFIGDIQIVGMSATIGNLPELACFLNADVYQKDFRPVELREFIKCGSDLLEIKKGADCIENAFVHDRTVSFNVSTFFYFSKDRHKIGTIIYFLHNGSTKMMY